MILGITQSGEKKNCKIFLKPRMPLNPNDQEAYFCDIKR